MLFLQETRTFSHTMEKKSWFSWRLGEGWDIYPCGKSVDRPVCLEVSKNNFPKRGVDEPMLAVSLYLNKYLHLHTDIITYIYMWLYLYIHGPDIYCIPHYGILLLQDGITITPGPSSLWKIIDVKHASWGGGLRQWSWSSLLAGHHQVHAQNPAPRMYETL